MEDASRPAAESAAGPVQKSYKRLLANLLPLAGSFSLRGVSVSTETISVRTEYSYSTLNWITAVVMVIFHILAIAAFFFFSWTNLAVALVLHWFAVGFGISLGYHRLHTHRGYKTSKAFEYFLAVCGTLSLEGGPIFWVATHRVLRGRDREDEQPVARLNLNPLL